MEQQEVGVRLSGDGVAVHRDHRRLRRQPQEHLGGNEDLEGGLHPLGGGDDPGQHGGGLASIRGLRPRKVP